MQLSRNFSVTSKGLDEAGAKRADIELHVVE